MPYRVSILAGESHSYGRDSSRPRRPLQKAWLGMMMNFNKIHGPCVGADLSRPPPIYRPPETHRHVHSKKLKFIITPLRTIPLLSRFTLKDRDPLMSQV